MPIEEITRRIAKLTENMVAFWGSARGWAPIEAAKLLSKSRLDWQSSLSRCLYLWIEPPEDQVKEGHQILAYATLGALVEGALKLFLSVWYKDYKNDVNAIIRRGDIVDPDILSLENLRIFFRDQIWGDAWDDWILRIQQRRNAIHAYRDRDIGDHAEFIEDVREYLEFLRDINRRLPYPDEIYVPSEV